MNTKASILLLAAGLCATSALQAQKIKGTRALPILEYAQSAQTAALGGNHYGESDVSHLYTNPTSLLYGETVLSLGGGLRTLGKVEGFMVRITSTTLRSASASDVMPSSAASAISVV